MGALERSLLFRLLSLVLRPAVSFCLRHSIKLQDLQECLKVALVRAAAESLAREGHKPNVSRISVMTGVHRRDVMRINTGEAGAPEDRDLVTKIIGQWRTDSKFQTKSGECRVLSCSGEGSDFARLCSSVSSDVNPGTVLFELERIGAIVPAKGGVRLVHESYVPQGDPLAGFTIFSEDTTALLDTVEENVLQPEGLPQFHAQTSYDNVRPDALPEIRRWFLKHGHEFHAKVRALLARHDQDINPDPKFKGKGTKVTFGSFSNIAAMGGPPAKKRKSKKGERE